MADPNTPAQPFATALAPPTPRAIGWLLLVIGVSLLGAGGWLLVFTTTTPASVPAGMARHFMILLICLCLMGVVTAANGAFVLRTGRQNLVLRLAALACVVGIAAMAYLIVE